MSVPTRYRPDQSYLGSQGTVAPNSISRSGMPMGPPKPLSTPPLDQLIKQQPLPDAMTAQYNQLMAMYQQQMQQLQGYGPGMNAMQNQINSLTAASGNNPMQARLLAMYRGDPYADLRKQQLQQEQGNPRLSQAYYVGDWGGY